MDILSVYAFRQRRIRVSFTAPVAAGGFSTSLYSVTSEDATSASPTVRAVYGVAGQPNLAELVLDFDLIDGASYVVVAGSVPAVGGGSTPSNASARFRYASATKPVNVEPIVSDLDIILFGRDLVWSG